MILSDTIIDDIRRKSRLLFDRTGDFELLSTYVYKETGRTIGVTTLKRLFGYINDSRKTSEYTLNTIALYMGCQSWNAYVSSNKLDSEWGFDDESIYISDLEIGTKLTVQYLNRVVSFEVCVLEGQHVLSVISSQNSSLCKGDILFVCKIKKGNILEAEKVLRGAEVGNYRTNGEIKVIEFIK